MPNSQKLLETWTNLKQSLLETIQQLKKDRFVILPTLEINNLRRQCETKRTQQSQLEHQRSNALLSQSDELKRQSLIQEVKDIQQLQALVRQAKI